MCRCQGGKPEIPKFTNATDVQLPGITSEETQACSITDERPVVKTETTSVGVIRVKCVLSIQIIQNEVPSLTAHKIYLNFLIELHAEIYIFLH